MRRFEIRPEWDVESCTAVVREPSMVEVDEKLFMVRRRTEDARIVDVTVDECTMPVVVRQTGTGAIELSFRGYTYKLHLNDMAYEQWYAVIRSGSHQAQSTVGMRAPMPGLLKSCQIQVGQQVRKGESLFVLEAMKMENVMKAPVTGVIQSIEVNEGNAVEKGTLLCVINTGAEGTAS